jgi:hypothetical protein
MQRQHQTKQLGASYNASFAVRNAVTVPAPSADVTQRATHREACIEHLHPLLQLQVLHTAAAAAAAAARSMGTGLCVTGTLANCWMMLIRTAQPCTWDGAANTASQPTKQAGTHASKRFLL